MDDEELALLDEGRADDMGGRCREGSLRVMEVWEEEGLGEHDSRG